MKPALKEAFEQYIVELERTKAASYKVIRHTSTSELSNITKQLNDQEAVTLPEDFVDYLSKVGGYDDSKCEQFNLYEPEFIWGMCPIESDYLVGHYAGQAELGNETQWPKGFIPFLENGSGNYVMINCIKESPTYGAIYDYTQGVGINQISKDLPTFFIASGQELKKGIRVFEAKDYSLIRDKGRYFTKGKELFDHSPYFDRKDQMETQVIDWK